MRLGFDAKRIFHNATGLGNYGRDLIRILSEQSINNYYFLYNPKPKKINRLLPNKHIIELLPDKKLWQIFSSFWRQKPILNQLIKDNIELYHGLSGELPRGIDKTNIKSVVTIHDLIFVRYPKLYSFFDRKAHFNKFLYACQAANKVVAISEQTKNDIVEFLKIDASKIEVIYQGCHPVFKIEQSEDRIETIRKKYNLPKEFILNVGTIEARKNVLTVIKAIKNLSISLVIVGAKKNYFKEIEAYIQENHLQDRIYFLSKLDLEELAGLYQMASIFVYPSLFEGFGIPIIEALYSKTSVITSKYGCFPEAGGPDSIYINPNNIEELSEAINRLLKDGAARKKIAEKGFNFVQKFNDNNIFNNWSKLYKSVIDNNS